MMRFRITVLNEPVAHRLWKGNVDKPVSMNMSNFPIAQSKLRSSESMRRQRDAVPGAGGLANSLFRILNSHNALFSLGLCTPGEQPESVQND